MDSDFLSSSLLARLRDDDPSVVAAVLAIDTQVTNLVAIIMYCLKLPQLVVALNNNIETKCLYLSCIIMNSTVTIVKTCLCISRLYFTMYRTVNSTMEYSVSIQCSTLCEIYNHCCL